MMTGAAFLVMTNGELKQALAVTVNRPDLSASYQMWINQSLQAITQRTKWAFLGRKRRDVVIPSGSTSASMPSDFRGLTEEHPSVVVMDGSGAQTPCKVVSEESTLNRTMWSTLASRPGEMLVFLTPDEEGGTLLNIYGIAGETYTFKVRYVTDAPTFEEDDDTSELTERYPLLVKSELFSIAFSEINDFVMAGTWAAMAATKLREAEYDDYQRRRSGRTMRFGG